MSTSPEPAKSDQASAVETPAGGVDPAAVESLLDEAQQALSSIEEPAATVPPGVRTFEFNDLVGAASIHEPATLELLRDVQLDLKIELGRTRMYLEDVLRLKEGAVVTLDKLAGDPVDVYANGRLVARGEVLVLNDNFCVRVAELIAGDVADA
jgi:flagellar motor switch protein FliN/FliY